MIEMTAKDYRGSFEKHLGQWGDTPVNRLPNLEINQYLNALQVEYPHAAHRSASVAGAVVRSVNHLCALALQIPRVVRYLQSDLVAWLKEFQ